jgi:hypothetical protein
MLQPQRLLPLLLAALSSLSSVHATPTDPLTHLTCNCISFLAGEATPCKISDTQNMDWASAQVVASFHELPIQFASNEVASKILDAETPLPTSVLLRMSDGTPLPPQGLPSRYSTDWIICGIDEAAKPREKLRGDEDARSYDVYILQVIVALIFIVILYEAGEVIVRRLGLFLVCASET